MVLKSAIAAIACAIIILASGGSSRADEYRPDEYLNLDLSKAVLSPKRLGPPAEFAPLPIEARSDTKRVVTERIVTPRKVRVAQPRVEKPRAAVRSKLARRHSNPLDANAMDMRVKKPVQSSVHVWPCKSGGICNWKR
jgi:hypothetical protein